MSNPLTQFAILPLVPLPTVAGVDLSITNSAVMMILTVIIAFATLYYFVNPSRLLPSVGQACAEMYYKFIRNLVQDTAGIEALRYLPFVFALFTFVLLGNLFGMLPYSFTFTSHIIVTLALALLVFVTVTIIGLVRHGLHFFHLFFPEGAPLILAPVLVPVEIFSYFVRPMSLSVRLFANMLVGHILLKVVLGFVVTLGVFGVLPFVFTILLIGFEVFVALIQAYIFALLTCIYLKDAIHLH